MPGVLEIDTLLGGWDRVTAGYLVEGPSPVLVETGSQSSVPVVLEALAEHGLGPFDLAAIVVTHIHLDHAGGVGDIARAFPKATVLVHPRGARHLADPSRLIASAATVYGDALDSLYGRLDATDPGRVKALEDGEDINIGRGRSLTTVHSPGHAKHHLALQDSDSGALFVGDAVGVRLPDAGVLRPATPPADFDLDQALDSLGRFAARAPVASPWLTTVCCQGMRSRPWTTPATPCGSGQALPRRLGARAKMLRRHCESALAANSTRPRPSSVAAWRP